ncbi:hypothetical protein Hanom_Chr09g00779611 [Helianthus anomalus]
MFQLFSVLWGCVWYVCVLCVCVNCVCILLILLFELGIKSAYMCGEVGILRLELSLYRGDIRMAQVFVFNHCFSFLVLEVNPSQKLVNPFLGQWPVCVVYIKSCWIRSMGWWRKGLLRLEDSLCLGVIRMVQIFVNRQLFSFSVFVFRNMQRFGNLYLGKKPVCVVYFRSIWIRGKGVNVGNQEE